MMNRWRLDLSLEKPKRRMVPTAHLRRGPLWENPPSIHQFWNYHDTPLPWDTPPEEWCKYGEWRPIE
jgi:hypothetical protein